MQLLGQIIRPFAMATQRRATRCAMVSVDDGRMLRDWL